MSIAGRRWKKARERVALCLYWTRGGTSISTIEGKNVWQTVYICQAVSGCLVGGRYEYYQYDGRFYCCQGCGRCY